MIERMIAAVFVAFAALASALLGACGDRDGSGATQLRAREAEELGADDGDLALPIPSGATPEQIVELKAKKYAAGLVADGEPIKGSVAAGGRSDHLAVLRAGRCYRVVAAGSDGVEDMDLLLYDPEGVLTQQDPAEDRFPVLGLQAEICPPEGGAYRLQVHMYKGGGEFAARIYRTP
jgi:hypothetical protein